MLYDLHTHSNTSDGHLDPAELLGYAADHGVTCLSITDHDTVAAYKQLTPADHPGIQLLPGIEFSTTWQKRSIHILGLHIDPTNAVLLAGIDAQQRARRTRAKKIAQRLMTVGIDDPYAAVAALAGSASIGRPHFARHLVDIGKVPDSQSAFRKYLGAGKIGDVKQGWASLEDVVAWINAAGGIAVLAHPTKYKFTMTKLRAMLEDFKNAGGRGIEVVCGHQEANVTRRMAGIANDFELHASMGSDFHHPANRWSRPGGFSRLPDNVTPVWDLW
ncbi:MAG: PHP domain-containing protein [Gammaproteobacteria bacterium]|nr:PHP domain-containing protein [Gammaproteobacteria bacterium]